MCLAHTATALRLCVVTFTLNIFVSFAHEPNSLMKRILIIAMLLASLAASAQTENPDLDNLIALSEIYSKNVNATGEDFKMAVEKLRTPNLNHIIDALIASGEGDEKLLTKEFLSKPDEQELKYWYVIREIHYNNNLEVKKKRPNRDIAQDVLRRNTDDRWLLDNYYYRIMGGIARLFNTTDLSQHDFDFNEYGLKDDTERAILFFSLTDALIIRFQVLKMVKNNDKLLEFASKLPSFNGRPYFEYADFNFEDFDWIGYDKKELYKQKCLGKLYSYLGSHFEALAEKNEGEKARTLYVKSILSRPEFFKYAGKMEKDLKDIYKKLREQ